MIAITAYQLRAYDRRTAKFASILDISDECVTGTVTTLCQCEIVLTGVRTARRGLPRQCCPPLSPAGSGPAAAEQTTQPWSVGRGGIAMGHGNPQ